jgi:hypothetical protein
VQETVFTLFLAVDNHLKVCCQVWRHKNFLGTTFQNSQPLSKLPPLYQIPFTTS